MQIETVAIARIKTASYNPRLDLKPGDVAYERLKRSIEELTLSNRWCGIAARATSLGGISV